MKEKLGLRNAILWTVALVALVICFASFSATATLKGSIPGEGAFNYSFHGAVWGIKYLTGYAGKYAVTEAIPEAYRASSIFGIIAVILLFLASGGLVLSTLLVKDPKVSKTLIIVCGGVILVAAVLLFFVQRAGWKQTAKMLEAEVGRPVSVQEVKDLYGPYIKAGSPYGIGAGIVSILLAGGVIASQLFVPDIKFIKSK